MNNDIIFEAISQINDELIAEAKRTAKIRQIFRTVSVCTVACTIVLTAILLFPKGSSSPSMNPQLQSPPASEPSATAPTKPNTPIGSEPTTPSTPTPPIIPSDIPGTIILNHKITSNTPLQGCVGSLSDTQSSKADNALPIFGVTVSAKPVEIIDGIYTYVDDPYQRFYRIVRMETITCHFGTGMPNEFFLLCEASTDADFLKYDSILMNELTSCGYENQILLNTENNEFRSFNHIIFLSYHLAGIKNGTCTGTLWENESYHGMSETQLIDEFVKIMGQTEKSNVKSLTSIVNSTALDALQWVEPFKNGIFIQSLDYYDMFSNQIHANYRRYLNGYPTNETISISETGAYYSGQKFTPEDILNLPDLPSALLEVTNAFSEGQIQPPHIVISDTLTMTKHTIHGWYAKSGNQVYGIIRVGWRFEDNMPYACTDPYFDDKYYLIQQNSDLIIPLETKELFEILESGAEDYIFNGEYNENGMIYPLMPMC